MSTPTTYATRFLFITILVALVLTISACGGSDEKQTPKAIEDASLSLKETMNDASRDLDQVRNTRSSLDRLSSVLQDKVSSTSEDISILKLNASSDKTASQLLVAAEQQRSFLQYAANSARARSWKTAKGDLSRANEAGQRAVNRYENVASQNRDIAGLLPESSAFRIGRLSAAVRSATKKKSSKAVAPVVNNTYTPPASSSAGWVLCEEYGNDLYIAAATTCGFASNVRTSYNTGETYQSNITAYSPTTKRYHSMSCNPDGAWIICKGGDRGTAAVRFPRP